MRCHAINALLKCYGDAELLIVPLKGSRLGRKREPKSGIKIGMLL